MRVRALTISLRPIGPGAAWATTVRASLVSSDARSTASTTSMWPSSPSTDASHRRTFRTISSWVSPSKERLGIAKRLAARAPFETEHAFQARPGRIDRADLGVDPPGRQRDRPYRVLGHVRGDRAGRGRLLGPAHPDRSRRRHGGGEGSPPGLELSPAGDEDEHHVEGRLQTPPDAG